MTRLLLGLLLVGAGLAVSLVAGQEPADQGEPLRLKKKKRAEPPRDGPAAPKEDEKSLPARKKALKEGKEKAELEPEDGKAEPEEDQKDVLARIARNMRAAEEKLANSELGEPTQQTQRDALKDLDDLINRVQRPPPPQDDNGGGGGGGGEKGGEASKGGGEKAQSGGKNGGQQAKSGRGSGSRAERRRQRQLARQKSGGSGTSMARGSGASKQPSGSGSSGPGSKGGAGKTSPTGKRPNVDVETDVWGHLPESLRAEMNAYSNPQPFLPRYDDQIKKYYRTIAEQGRRKGD